MAAPAPRANPRPDHRVCAGLLRHLSYRGIRPVGWGQAERRTARRWGTPRSAGQVRADSSGLILILESQSPHSPPMDLHAECLLLQGPQLHQEILKGKTFLDLNPPEPVLLSPEDIDRAHERALFLHGRAVPRMRINVDRPGARIIPPAFLDVFGTRQRNSASSWSREYR